MCSPSGQPSLIAKYTRAGNTKPTLVTHVELTLLSRLPSVRSLEVSHGTPQSLASESPSRTRSPVVCREQRPGFSYRGILCRLRVCVCVCAVRRSWDEPNQHSSMRRSMESSLCAEGEKSERHSIVQPKCDPYTVMSCAFPSSPNLPSCIPSAEKNP